MMNRANTMSGLSALGRYGDTELAHVNRAQRRFLKRKGGAGTRNPRTGLQEYWGADDTGVDGVGGSSTAGGNNTGQGNAGSVDGSDTSGVGIGSQTPGAVAAATGPAVDASVGAEASVNSHTVPNDQSIVSPLDVINALIAQEEQAVQGPQGITGISMIDNAINAVVNPNPSQIAIQAVPAIVSMLAGGIGPSVANGIASAIGSIANDVFGATNEGAVAGQGVVGEGGPAGNPGDFGAPQSPMDQPAVYATPQGVQYASAPAGFGLRMPGLSPLRMAHGGRVRGGALAAAERARGSGRHGDSELVHLSPEELELLRQKWGEPTINPETGLPEYFKIGKLLKGAANVVIPAAATYFTGNPMIGALAAAGTGLATGKSLGSALGQGLLAYGTGKLYQGTDFSGEGDFLDSSRISSVGSDFKDLIPSVQRAFESGGGLREIAPSGMDIGEFSDVSRTPDWIPSAPLPKPSAEGGGGGFGLKGLVPLATVGAGLAGGAGKAQTQQASEAVPNVADSAPPPKWRLERIYNPGGGQTGRDYFTDVWVNDDTGQRMHMAQGGQVAGPGGGQDDKIPAMLSDGEYVIDAATVSDIGDGSTQAGAKKLDAMRQRIRSHKRGAAGFPPKARNPLSYLGAK